MNLYMIFGYLVLLTHSLDESPLFSQQPVLLYKVAQILKVKHNSLSRGVANPATNFIISSYSQQIM